MPYKTLIAVLLCALIYTPAAAQMKMDHATMEHAAHGEASPEEDGPEPQWQIHSHAVLTLVYSQQGGPDRLYPKGADKSFVSGMMMFMAGRDFGAQNRLDLSLMLTPDALMGKSGYPLLLQTGETADGRTHLVNAQHPHDLFMDLSAKWTHRFDDQTRGFIKLGWPSDAGFGPEVFMHRQSGEAFPTAPISHHWLDSTHVSMGVIGAGFERGPLKLEVTQFTGREPDENRYDIEPARLDSTSLRLTYALTPDIKAQASWADVKSPESLEPDVDLTKTSYSLSSNLKLCKDSILQMTLAYARKEVRGHHDDIKPQDAYLIENTLELSPKWQVLARYERVYNAELALKPLWVAKAELGAIRQFDLNARTQLGLGFVRQFNRIPDSLKLNYGDDLQANVGFMRLRFF
jgi:hypothetical protein